MTKLSTSEIGRILTDVQESTSRKLSAISEALSRSLEGEDMKTCFPDILRGSAVCNDDFFKRLSNFFFNIYADDNKETALLYINIVSKDLCDKSPILRSLSLRVLVSPVISEISHILPESLKRASLDSSTFTKCIAVGVCMSAAFAFEVALVPIENSCNYILRLLDSADSVVLSSTIQAALAYYHICFPAGLYECPNFDFNKFLSVFTFLDTAGKISSVQLLTLYARQNFCGPSDPCTDFEALSDIFTVEATFAESAALLSVLVWSLSELKCSIPVAAVLRTIQHTAVNQEVHGLFLKSLIPIVAKNPDLFLPSIGIFFLHESDSDDVKKNKISILSMFTDSVSTVNELLKELQQYCFRQSPSEELTSCQIHLCQQVGDDQPSQLTLILTGLVRMIDSFDIVLASEVVEAIRAILKAKKIMGLSPEVIVTFAASFVKMKSFAAQAGVLWVLTEFHHIFPVIYPDLLRTLPWEDIFSPNGSSAVQSQAIILASRVLVFHSENVSEISTKICTRLVNIVHFALRLGMIRGSSSHVRSLATALWTIFTRRPEHAKVLLDDMLEAEAVFENENKEQLQIEIGTYFPFSISHYVQYQYEAYSGGLPDFASTNRIEVKKTSAKREVAGVSCISNNISTKVEIPVKLVQPRIPIGNLADLNLFFDEKTESSGNTSDNQVLPSIKPAVVDLKSAGKSLSNIFN